MSRSRIKGEVSKGNRQGDSSVTNQLQMAGNLGQ